MLSWSRAVPNFTRLLVGLSLSLAFIVAELVGFLTGLSMFSELTNLFCIQSYPGSLLLIIHIWISLSLSLSLSCTYTYTHTCTHAHMCTNTYTHTHTHTCILYWEGGWYMIHAMCVWKLLDYSHSLAIVAHVSAAITLAVFITEVWSCDLFWYIFGFCRYTWIVIVKYYIYIIICTV